MNKNLNCEINIEIENAMKTDKILKMKNGIKSANNLIKYLKELKEYFILQNKPPNTAIWANKINICNELILQLENYIKARDKNRNLFDTHNYQNFDCEDNYEYQLASDNYNIDYNDFYDFLQEQSKTKYFAIQATGGMSGYGLKPNIGVIHSFITSQEFRNLLMEDFKVYYNKQGVFVSSIGHDGEMTYQIKELNHRGDNYYQDNYIDLDDIFYKKGYCRNLKIKS